MSLNYLNMEEIISFSYGINGFDSKSYNSDHFLPYQ